MGITFTEIGSKIFFLVVFFQTAVFMGGCNYFTRRHNKIASNSSLILCFLFLAVPLGLRTGGIDHSVYLEWFNRADYWMRINYHGSPEPLFAGLTLFAKSVLNNFQFIYIFSAIIFTIGIIKYIKGNCFSGFIALMFINVSIYLYMCGLARMSIAIGICTYALKYIDNKKKYILLILIAILFHYSAVLMFLVMFAYYTKRNFAIKNSLYIVVAFYIFGLIIDRFSGSLPYAIMRLALYVEPNFNIAGMKGVIVLIPAIFLWFIFKGSYKKINLDNFLFIDNIIKISIVLVFVAMIFQGTFRFTFYLTPFIAKVYSDFVVVLKKSKQFQLIPLYYFVFTVTGFWYVNEVFYTSQFIAPYIVPFSM